MPVAPRRRRALRRLFSSPPSISASGYCAYDRDRGGVRDGVNVADASSLCYGRLCRSRWWHLVMRMSLGMGQRNSAVPMSGSFTDRPFRPRAPIRGERIRTEYTPASLSLRSISPVEEFGYALNRARPVRRRVSSGSQWWRRGRSPDRWSDWGRVPRSGAPG